MAVEHVICLCMEQVLGVQGKIFDLRVFSLTFIYLAPHLVKNSIIIIFTLLHIAEKESDV